MKQVSLTVAENEAVAADVFRMTLRGDVSAVTTPGQFLNIQVENGFLRRPVSVHDKNGDTVTILYKTVGHGTSWLRARAAGDALDVLTGLGNGFDLASAGSAPLLIGGGIGAAPLYYLAKELRRQGNTPAVALGFNTAADVLCEEAFHALGCAVTLSTADGSRGVRGFVTDALNDKYDYFYACGPLPMLRAVYRATRTGGQFSLEERMGCGFGACMGCTCETVAGGKRVCKDGPVFRKEELPWDA